MDAAAARAMLLNSFGDDHGPAAPAQFRVRLFVGNPRGDGVELADETVVDGDPVPNGYAAVLIDNDSAQFPAPDAGDAELVSAPVAWPESLEAWPGVTHWVLCDPDTDARWPSGRIGEGFSVSTAGVTPRLTLSLRFVP